WTDPYPTRQAGQEGVTVWMPVGDGRTLVGADIAVQALTANVLQTQISGLPGAYAILLSSSDKLLPGSPAVARDSHLPKQYVATLLPEKSNATFDSTLSETERSGHPKPLRATFATTDRELFTAPVYAPHWILATSVPIADLEPDVSGLARGVD